MLADALVDLSVVLAAFCSEDGELAMKIVETIVEDSEDGGTVVKTDVTATEEISMVVITSTVEVTVP